MSSNEGIIGQLGDDTLLWSAAEQKTAKPSDVLGNKVVLLYFSASWCGPCQRFTPLLKGLYKNLKSRSEVEDFEIVFCSMDRTDAEYESYTSDMPWWRLPYKSTCMGKLVNIYGAQGIPHLVVLDKDGSVILPDAVGQVSSIDPEGRNFPWRPKPLVELLPTHYLCNNSSRAEISQLDSKYLMLYFCAHWCPPCQRFTPLLSKAYTTLKQHRDDFELLFVSSDHDQQAFDEYFSEMTFCALPYEERAAKAAIASRLQVRGIPTLMIFGPRPKDGGDRPLINKNVRGIIEQGDYLYEFPFAPKPYGDLNKASDNINAIRCVIVFHEAGDDEEQEDIQEALKMAAENYKGKDSVKFYWAVSPTGLTQTVREALKLGPAKEEPVMVLLDIPDGGAYYICESTDISIDGILKFVNNPGKRLHL